MKGRTFMDSGSGPHIFKNSGNTTSPQSFTSPPITESKSIRHSLISLFKGTDKSQKNDHLKNSPQQEYKSMVMKQPFSGQGDPMMKTIQVSNS